VRAFYTAIPVASVLNILDEELTQGVGNYILSCQTYEGGIAGEPGSEAHGGQFNSAEVPHHLNCPMMKSRILIFPLIRRKGMITSIPVHVVRSNTESPPLYQSHAMQQFVLLCSQVP
nr:protein farnesyltransferase subunit beta [Tanacetum cinerariifolium]